MWKSILSIAASILGIAQRRNEDENAADVKAARKDQDQENAKGSEVKAVADQDVETIRKNLAE